VVVKFTVSLRVKVLEKELTKERTLSREARKERNEALEETKLLKRESQAGISGARAASTRYDPFRIGKDRKGNPGRGLSQE